MTLNRKSIYRSPQVRRCHFEQQAADFDGGGASARNLASSPSIRPDPLCGRAARDAGRPIKGESEFMGRQLAETGASALTEVRLAQHKTPPCSQESQSTNRVAGNRSRDKGRQDRPRGCFGGETHPRRRPRIRQRFGRASDSGLYSLMRHAVAQGCVHGIPDLRVGGLRSLDEHDLRWVQGPFCDRPSSGIDIYRVAAAFHL